MANTRADPPAAAWRATGLLALLPPFAFLLALSPAGPAAGAPAAAAAPLPACTTGNICLSADDTEYRRDRVLLHGIVIYRSDSPLRVEARTAEASSLDFADSTWTLTGEVRVRTEQGELSADSATVHFTASRLGDALASGAPASFEQLGDAEGARLARGRARQIDYDPVAGEVRLSGEAWLTDGCNETSSERITYDFAQQRVRAQGAAGARVQGTIRPQCKPARPPAAGAAPASGGSEGP